eukprot:3184034-Pyramimonas_sp.AAC.1
MSLERFGIRASPAPAGAGPAPPQQGEIPVVEIPDEGRAVKKGRHKILSAEDIPPLEAWTDPRALSVDVMQAMCKRLGLVQRGSRPEVVARLVAAQAPLREQCELRWMEDNAGDVE